MYFLQIQADQITGFSFKNPEKKITEIPLVTVNTNKGLRCVAFGESSRNNFGMEKDRIYVCNPFQSYNSILEDHFCSEEFLRWFIDKKLLPRFRITGPEITVQMIGYGREPYPGECKIISEMILNAGARKVHAIRETTQLNLNNAGGPLAYKVKRTNDSHLPNSTIKSWSDNVL